MRHILPCMFQLCETRWRAKAMTNVLGMSLESRRDMKHIIRLPDLLVCHQHPSISLI